MLLAGHSKAEVFVMLKYLFQSTDMRLLACSSIEKYQGLSSLITGVFLQRNPSVSISKDRNFMSRFELSLINLLITMFTTYLGVPESLSVFAFLTKFGVQGLISLAVSILEMSVINLKLRNSLDDFYSELRQAFEPRYYMKEKRYTVSNTLYS